LKMEGGNALKKTNSIIGYAQTAIGESLAAVSIENAELKAELIDHILALKNCNCHAKL